LSLVTQQTEKLEPKETCLPQAVNPQQRIPELAHHRCDRRQAGTSDFLCFTEGKSLLFYAPGQEEIAREIFFRLGTVEQVGPVEFGPFPADDQPKQVGLRCDDPTLLHK
jgi:hypothetical protein